MHQLKKSKIGKPLLKWMKRILFFFLGAIIILLLTVVSIFHLKKDIIEKTLLKTINKEQNGELTFSSMSLSPPSYLPDLAVSLDSVLYYEKTSEERQLHSLPIITLDRVDVAFDVLALMRGVIDIEEIYLANGKANIIVYPDNTTNLENALGLTQKDTIKEIIPIEKSTEEPTPTDFRLENLEIKNVVVYFEQQNNHLEAEAIIENLKTSLDYTHPFSDVDLEVDLRSNFFNIDNNEFLIDKKLSLVSIFRFDETEGIATIDQGSLLFNNLFTTINGTIDFKNDSLTNLNFDASDQDLTLLSYLVEDEILNFNPDFLKKGDIELKGKISGFNANRLPIVEVDFAAKDIHLNFPDGRKAVDDLDIKGYFQTGDSIDLSEIVLNVEELNATLPGGSITGTFNWSNYVHPQLSLKLDLEADLVGYDQIFKLDPLNNLAGKIKLNTDLSAELDPSTQQVKENINDFEVNVENLAFAFPKLSYPFENISGTITDIENKLAIQNLSCDYATSNILVDGILENTLASLLHNEVGLEGNFHLKSDNIVLNDMPFRKWLPYFFDAQTIDSFNVDVKVESNSGFIDLISQFSGLNLSFSESAILFDSLPDVSIDTAILKIFEPKIDSIVVIENLDGKVFAENRGSISLQNTSILVDTQSVDISAAIEIENTDPYAFLRQMRLVDHTFGLNGNGLDDTKILNGQTNLNTSFQIHTSSFAPSVLSDFQMEYQFEKNAKVNVENGTIQVNYLTLGENPAFELIPGVSSFAGNFQVARLISNTGPDGKLTIKNGSFSFDEQSVEISTVLEAENIKPVAFLKHFQLMDSTITDQATTEFLNGQTNLKTKFGLDFKTFSPLNLTNIQFNYQFTDTTFLQLGNGNIRLDKLVLVDSSENEIIPGVASISGEIELEQIKPNVATDLGLICQLDGNKNKLQANFSLDKIPGADENGVIIFTRSGKSLAYQINYNLKNYPIGRMLDRFYNEKLMTGKIDIKIDASSKGKEMDEMIKNAIGNLSVSGENMILYGIDLDELLKRYKKSQNFNLVDISAYFIVGPMGAVATKGMNFASLLNVSLSPDEKTQILQLISSWEINNGILKASDVGFVTPVNRVVLGGSIDLPRDSIEKITVSVIDQKGCSLISQSLWGNYTQLQHGKVNVLGKLLGAVVNVLELVTGSKCKPIYDGKLEHPVKKK